MNSSNPGPADQTDDCGQIAYRMIGESGLTPQLFAAFNRFQEVKQCWRKERDSWVLKDVAFIENWSAEALEHLARCLRDTLRQGGTVSNWCHSVDVFIY